MRFTFSPAEFQPEPPYPPIDDPSDDHLLPVKLPQPPEPREVHQR